MSSEEGDAHFQYACAAIASTNPNVAMALKSPKAYSGVYGSWIVSQCLIYVATWTLPPRCRKPSEHQLCLAMAVDCILPRNVRFLVMNSECGLLRGQ
jgi:hypothetical protein